MHTRLTDLLSEVQLQVYDWFIEKPEIHILKKEGKIPKLVLTFDTFNCTCQGMTKFNMFILLKDLNYMMKSTPTGNLLVYIWSNQEGLKTGYIY
jgi:hypothetical protein